MKAELQRQFNATSALLADMDAKRDTSESVAELMEANNQLRKVLDALDAADEPEAWQFQHKETGQMTELSRDGINTPETFLRDNPRFEYVGPLYRHPPRTPSSEPAQELAKFANDLVANQKETPPDIARALNEHMGELLDPEPAQEPRCPNCTAATLLYECTACSASNYPSPEPAQVVPYLANGTRFKLAPGKYGAEFRAFPSDLAGRWVALVDATDRKHITPTAKGVACVDCNGVGERPCEVPADDGNPENAHTEILMCPTCNGTGEPFAEPAQVAGVTDGWWTATECANIIEKRFAPVPVLKVAIHHLRGTCTRVSDEMVERAVRAYNNSCAGANHLELDQRDCMREALETALSLTANNAQVAGDARDAALNDMIEEWMRFVRSPYTDPLQQRARLQAQDCALQLRALLNAACRECGCAEFIETQNGRKECKKCGLLK